MGRKMSPAALKIMSYRNQKYHDKIEEYSKLTLEELEAKWQESISTKNRIGGTYKLAFLEVYTRKKRERFIKDSAEANKEQKVEEPTSDEPEPVKIDTDEQTSNTHD